MINTNFLNFRVSPITDVVLGIIEGKFNDSFGFNEVTFNLHCRVPRTCMAGMFHSGLLPTAQRFESFSKFDVDENIHLIQVPRFGIEEALENLGRHGLRPCLHPANYLLGLFAHFSKVGIPEVLAKMNAVTIAGIGVADDSIIGKKRNLCLVARLHQIDSRRIEVRERNNVCNSSNIMIIAREVKNSIYPSGHVE